MAFSTVTSSTVVIGAGPAGLAAAYELTKQNQAVTLLEQSDKVGGRSRYESDQGYTFDLGGHPFTTSIEAVRLLWNDLIPDDRVRVSAPARIVYRHRFFDYPLSLTNALKHIGPFDGTQSTLSYLAAQVQSVLNPTESVETAEGWLQKRFGSHLYSLFFGPYLQKVLGLLGSQVHSDWVATRLPGESLPRTMGRALTCQSSASSGHASSGSSSKTAFDYPVLGPGMLWERCRTRIELAGGNVRVRSRVVQIERTGQRIDRVIVEKTTGRAPVAPDSGQQIAGQQIAGQGMAEQGMAEQQQVSLSSLSGDQFISSLPLVDLILQLDPPAPPAIRRAAERLKYRALISVPILLDNASLFPSRCLYIHSPEYKVARIQNFKNWSAAMVPDASKTCLGMEYFCSEGDDLWARSNAELIHLASEELVELGLVPDRSSIQWGKVLRVPKAYPLYDDEYYKPLAMVQDYLEGFENLQTVGCTGLHRDLKHDFSTLTGLLAAQNILTGQSTNTPSAETSSAEAPSAGHRSNGHQYDLWSLGSGLEKGRSLRSSGTVLMG
ncbi:MAG: FAD-dependent oxidoreductase [Cyanobacteria bacterium P01_F01_bin.53]